MAPKVKTRKPAPKKAVSTATAPTAPSPAGSLPKASSPGLSPYPDLTMAIAMLQKRAKNLKEDSTRGPLLEKWVTQLSQINTEMQKLHKLEILASRLISPK